MIFSTGSVDFSRAPAHALSPLTSPCWLSTSAHFQPTTNPALSHYEAPGGLHICSLPTHDEPCRLPLRSPSRPLHTGGVSSEVDADAVGPRDALQSGDEGPLRLRDEGRHGAGMGGSRRRPRRGCLSLPFSGTRVSPTFRPVTPGAAGGVVAGEERHPVDRVTFDPEVKLWNGPFWLRKSALPGSGYFRSRSKLIILIATPGG